jgi:chitin disaccharide deacetylase
VPRRLIVNADDFGLTPGVSRGILGAHRHGIVTSTTVLVTQPVQRDVISRAQDTGLGLGLHVNLTLGEPLTAGRSLVGEDGRFIRDARRAAARVSMKDVETEVAAQVDKFLALAGTAPTHLDSHHHVALLVPVREVLLATARRLGVPVRSEDSATRRRVRATGLRTPDHFFGGSGPDAYWTPARTLAHLRGLPPGVSEFMSHPGHFDDALSFSRYGRQRETELIALGSPSARAAVESLGVKLCHFGDL